MSYTLYKFSELQILTHSVLFFDTLLLLNAKMIKKILKLLIHSNYNTHVDAKMWIQKILLEGKYGKINS